MKITNTHVFFFREWLSNFSICKFTWTAFGETHEFFCTEQAFMWAKAKTFGDERVAKEILLSQEEGNAPMVCKQWGREVANYDDDKWEKVRYEVMRDVNYAKYTQDEAHRQKLLDPKFDGKTFVEASPFDKIWGIKMDEDHPDVDDETKWKGRNLLGKAITEVRNMILNEKA